MRMVYASRATGARAIDFQFQNRQLLWDGFSDMALFLLPLVDWGRIGRRVTKLVRTVRSAATAGGGDKCPTAGAPVEGDAGDCAACGAAPANMPYRTGCGHTYCYYCLASACQRDGGDYACARCGETFETSKRR